MTAGGGTSTGTRNVLARAREYVHGRTDVRVFLVLFVAYALLTLAILFKTPVLRVDSAVEQLRLQKNYAWMFHFWHTYVQLGQRRPVLQLLLPFLVWVTLRDRSPRPLVSLFVAIVLLNLSVGVVKLTTGRQGPRYGRPVDDLFAHGDIYPSGHTSNSVLMYGLVAMFVAAKYRRQVIAVIAFICVTIGIGTVFINTHWVTDVVGGWLAGGLVLCAVPWISPYVERIVLSSYSRTRALISVLGGAIPLYFGLGAVTSALGPWLNHVFGGWLALGLLASSLPWLTPPIERWIAAKYRELRLRTSEPVAKPSVDRVPAGAR